MFSDKTKIIKFVLVIVCLAVASAGFAKYYPFRPKPCSKPLLYSLGTFDFKFELTKAQMLSDITAAEKIWEDAAHKNLFQYTPDTGPLKINLVYDYRQEATDKLKKLGYSIDSTQSSYTRLKARYDDRVATYNEEKSALDRRVTAFEERKKAYEDSVKYWNQNGGAPKPEAARLNSEYNYLTQEAEAINTQKDIINSLVNEINALVSILNNLASQLKLNVNTYNTVGSSRGDEFEEGLYVKDDTGTHIDLYEFSSNDQLIRLLAHEMGHALGLEHVADPNALMYRLNQSQTTNLAPDDLAELNRVCAIN